MTTTELVFRQDAYARSCAATVAAVDGNRVSLDRTVFYPTGGGQPGDIGTLSWEGQSARVAEAVKGEAPDSVVHVLADGDPVPAPGTAVTAEVDWERRHRLMRMHTTMHLVCSLVEGSVTGGQVGEAKSRLDFNIPARAVDKTELTDALNARIAAALPVEADWIDEATLDDNPDLVRTMSVKPPRGAGRIRVIRIGSAEAPADFQPCGGTHVRNTGEIGVVEVTKIENKGKQNRRIHIALVEA